MIVAAGNGGVYNTPLGQSKVETLSVVTRL